MFGAPCKRQRAAERGQPERQETNENFRDGGRSEWLLQGVFMHGSANVAFGKRKA
jgi:hypothetical protein